MSFENDDLYIDLNLSNSLQTNANSRVECKFMQSASQNILNSTNGYKMSIIRFALNTESLPLFIPTMKSKTDTIYSFTMEYNGAIHQQYMVFEPQNVNPVDIDEYYYVYSYNYLIYLINNCLSTCIKQVNSYATIPIMEFDITTKRASLRLNTTQYGCNEPNKVNVYMNYAMYSLFSSIPAYTVNKNSYGMDYQMNTKTSIINNGSYILEQEYSTTALWNPISSVVFTSNTLPIYQSQTPPVQIYEDGQLLNNSSSYSFLNIITDFVADNMEFVPYIQYAPGIYRYISLKPNVSIRDIDIQVYWLNKYTGKLKPLYIGVGGGCAIKILLTKDF